MFLCLVSKRKRTLNHLNQSTNPKQLRTISRLTVASCLDWCIGHCRRCRTGSPVEAGPVQHVSHVAFESLPNLCFSLHTLRHTRRAAGLPVQRQLRKTQNFITYELISHQHPRSGLDCIFWGRHPTLHFVASFAGFMEKI